MFTYRQVNCGTVRYKTFSGVNGVFILAYMSIPLVWFVLLYRARGHLNPPTSSRDANLVLWMRERDPALGALRFLYMPYRPQFYYWEALEL